MGFCIRGSSFVFLQVSFWERGLKLPKSRNLGKNEVHLYRSTRRNVLLGEEELRRVDSADAG